MQAPKKNNVFADYGAFLNALLPDATGFMFHDRHARLFWQDISPDSSELNDEYHQALKKILAGSTDVNAGENGRISLANSTAYLLPLISDQGRSLGALTALSGSDAAGMPYQFCKDLLQPALRSLTRELSLRIHLLETTTRLNIQDGEQEFWKMLGEKGRSNQSSKDTLRDILELTVNHLGQDGAVLLDPQHGLEINVGNKPSKIFEAEIILESLQELAAQSPDNVSAALASRPPPGPHDRTYSWPILEENKNVIGVLVLSRPAKMAKLSDHSNSLMNFVVSTIEHVLERGFDSLTSLINWSTFETALEVACSSGRANEFSVMYLDLDQLQVINDNFGRETGDEVLRGFADIIRDVLPGQQITRLTSDCFAALLDGVAIEQAQELGKDICKRLRKLDYAAGQRSFKPSASVGVAPLMPNENNVRSALVPAQMACQAAKGRGRGRCEMYASADASIIQRVDDLSMVGSIQSAIEGGRLVLFAQPIEHVTGQANYSYHEVLVRMLDTNGATIEPAAFLGAAERYQLMLELDRWVVSRAFEILRDNPTSPDGKPLHFAVNLSGQSLGNDQFLEFARSELSRTAVSPERIGFEITETVAVKNLQKAQLFMKEFKQMGCKFSLDDFGTGLSSFAYLKLFPVDRIKIDGSFIKDLSSNEISRSMVSAIVEIAKVMHVETVAEYVESEATLDAIRELGIDWAQGYYFGEPKRLRDMLGADKVTDETQLQELGSAVMTGLYKAI
jgi:diguanylate cyclase (GGDEF)-like protein